MISSVLQFSRYWTHPMAYLRGVELTLYPPSTLRQSWMESSALLVVSLATQYYMEVQAIASATHAVVSCMMGKPLSEIDIAVSSIVAPSVREVAHAIELATEDTQLADIPGVFEVLGTAGITLPLTCSNAPRLIRQLAVRDVLLKRTALIQAFQKGLNEVNIIDLVKKNPRVKSILLLKERPLDAEVLLSLISLPTTVSDEQRRTIDFLCQFLYTADTQSAAGVSSVHYWGFIGSTYGVSTSNISIFDT